VQRAREEHVEEGACGVPSVGGQHRRPDFRRPVRQQIASKALAARQRFAAEQSPARAWE
jgi:hypothetical protein